MIYAYAGHYPYTEQLININAPESIGVYYCGYVNNQNVLVTLYVGRAMGTGVTIRSRIQDHFRNDNWSDVSHFGYAICSTAKDAEDFEVSEIRRLQPKYNRR